MHQTGLLNLACFWAHVSRDSFALPRMRRRPGSRSACRLAGARPRRHGSRSVLSSLGHGELSVPDTIAGQRHMRATNSEAGQKAVSYLRDPGTALVFTFWAIGELETK